jgi:molybdopterin converting factor subunit 1
MKVLFFARLREALGEASIELSEDRLPATVGELRAQLRRHEREAFAEAMGESNVICAVNQHVAGDEQPLRAGDEVAFFPPVTGG